MNEHVQSASELFLSRHIVEKQTDLAKISQYGLNVPIRSTFLEDPYYAWNFLFFSCFMSLALFL